MAYRDWYDNQRTYLYASDPGLLHVMVIVMLHYMLYVMACYCYVMVVMVVKDNCLPWFPQFIGWWRWGLTVPTWLPKLREGRYPLKGSRMLLERRSQQMLGRWMGANQQKPTAYSLCFWKGEAGHWCHQHRRVHIWR